VEEPVEDNGSGQDQQADDLVAAEEAGLLSAAGLLGNLLFVGLDAGLDHHSALLPGCALDCGRHASV